MNPDTPKHNPEEIEARITAMLLGELTSAEEAEVRRTLESNPNLARLHERLKHAIELVREAVAQPAEAAVAQQSLPRMSEERRQRLLQQFKTVTLKKLSPTRRRGVPWVVPMSIAAALMALLTLGRLVSWDEFSNYNPTALLAPQVFRSRSAVVTKGESASPKITPSLISRMSRNVSDAKGESAGRSSGVDRFQTSGAAPTTEPLKRRSASAIYLPGQTAADKPVEVAQAAKLSGESRKNEPAKPTSVAPLMMSRTLGRTVSESKKEAESSFGIQLNTLPIPENPPVTSSSVANGVVFSANDPSVADNAVTTAKPDSLAGAPSTTANLGDASHFGWMFTTPPSVPEFKPAQVDKTGSLPLNTPALVAGTSADANSQTGPRANFSLTSPSPAAWGDYDNDGWLAQQNLSPALPSPFYRNNGDGTFTRAQQNFSPALPSPAPTKGTVESGSTNRFIGRFAYLAETSTTGSLPNENAAPTIDALDVLSKTESFGQDGNVLGGVLPNTAGGVEVGRGVQDINLLHANKDIVITGASSAPARSNYDNDGFLDLFATAQSPAPALPVDSLLGQPETPLSINEPVLKTQVAAPPGGTSNSRLAERSMAESSKQDELAQSVSAGNATEGSNVSSSSSGGEVPRQFFKDPQMIARYFGGKMPAGNLGAQAGDKAGSLEKMSDDKGALAAPTSPAIADQVAGVNGREELSRLNREQEQLVNSIESRKALKQIPDNVDFAKPLSSEGKNVTQLGEPEKDKLAKQRLAEVELRADRQSSSTSNKSDFYSLSLAKEAKQLEQEQKRAYASNAALIEPDSARTVNRPPPPEPQPEVPTQENAFSTFSLNVTDVSFKLAAASLEKGAMPEPATVRSEEFINAFNYRDPEPAPGSPVAFAWERTQYPYAHNRELIRFAIRTAARGREAGRPLNLVLLLDNSGSMERADRVRIIREALVVLARQLQAYDRISVVAFARTARLWVDALPGNQAGELAERVGNLPPDGGTNLEEALNLAYATAASHFLSQGVNRVVLLTDGAANLGDVNPESLRRKVESWRQRGVALDCFGIGWEGYNDDLLEVLSRNGDGRYGFVNTPEEATTEFAAQLAGALQVAASDVKVQVEFNPRRVEVWRQIGYAKHQLTKQQFRDNTVDAAELAAAETGNALYVIQVNPNGVGPIGMVRVRYREPDSGYYREHEWPVPYTGAALPLDRAPTTMRLAATASAFSEWLVSSPFAGEVTPDRLLNYLQGVPAVFEPDPRPQKLEWMIRQAKSISGK